MCSLVISTKLVSNSHVAIQKSLHNKQHMQTAIQTVLSESAPVCHCYKAPTKASDQHTTSPYNCALLQVLGPPHTFFFILRGSFSEPSPAQGTPVLLLLPVHQHKCMSRKASSLSFYFDLYYFVFPKALIVKLRPNGRLTWCEIYLFIMCHVYVLAFSFSL